MAVAIEVLHGGSRRRAWERLLPFLGPAFIASVAYVDPGNFATNIQGGAQFGYRLVWVILASNLMAMLVQALSAKLGIATGRNLAELLRDRLPRPLLYPMWLLMEGVAMATDLAEFLGAALGFNLLFHVPLLWGAVLTAVATFVILALERHGFRPLEAVISAMVGVIALAYVVETILDRPDWGLIVHHAVVPSFAGPESVLLATGILGATVMPHVVFLHSSLTQGRIVIREPQLMQRLFRYEVVDVVLAMGIAGLVNAAMLIMAASTFHRAGLTHVATIEDAHRTLQPLLGPAASWVFAISLLASGLSSSTVGTMSGQVIMQGFLHWHIPVWVRRIVTMAPSFVVIALGLEPTRTLVISQVVLSFGLPFAVVPLVIFTARRDIMGPLVNHRLTTAVAGAVSALIVVLNAYLLQQTLTGGL
ncbi:Nramp family divalent metal transporter [Carboxydochorda subterranea]|uniref:Divalent metal cation transporter MntH n=1 Tax=Carboxydichorda subterranea TaxID=3109565 RepID=A0ABZ1BXK8_9FIRM|nr:Nramp family divalent metal transporter [Limnochorda sp. L945t]WRP17240.1 Nramp family divalent metal transporter [Limnochorda sp. L945t]